MILYYTFVQPFESKFSNFLAIYNEIYFCSVCLLILLHNCNILSDSFSKMVGWFYIFLIGVSLLFTWIFMFPAILKNIFLYFKTLCVKNTKYSPDSRLKKGLSYNNSIKRSTSPSRYSMKSNSENRKKQKNNE